MKQETRVYIWLIAILIAAGGFRGFRYYQIKTQSEKFLMRKDSLFAVLNKRADSLFHSLNMAQSDTDTQLNINTATAAQLQTIPGIGPVLSKNIVEFRRKTDGIKNADELLKVKGLGKKKIKKLLRYIIF